MISTVVALIGIVALVPLLGAGGPDPSASIAARRLVAERAEAADAALHDLELAIAPGLDSARSGAAHVASGDEPPGSELVAAAELLATADPASVRAAETVATLEGARRAIGHPGEPLEPPADPGEVASIAAQLAGTAAAADEVAAMRLRADRVLVGLADALSALGTGQLAAAKAHLSGARADHEALAAWEIELVTLPVWLGTADALLGAGESILAATVAGDADAAAAAAREVEELSGEAAAADRALRIAMGEAASAVTAAPLSRLADLLRRTAETRVTVASIMHSVGR